MNYSSTIPLLSALKLQYYPCQSLNMPSMFLSPLLFSSSSLLLSSPFSLFQNALTLSLYVSFTLLPPQRQCPSLPVFSKRMLSIFYTPYLALFSSRVSILSTLPLLFVFHFRSFRKIILFIVSPVLFITGYSRIKEYLTHLDYSTKM